MKLERITYTVTDTSYADLPMSVNGLLKTIIDVEDNISISCHANCTTEDVDVYLLGRESQNGTWINLAAVTVGTGDTDKEILVDTLRVADIKFQAQSAGGTGVLSISATVK